eukprot:m.365668 g.365668  ORF g.365668 m.365668 type:complete len:127 (+) comp20819_c0_seq6:294-674(+)
MQTITRIVRLRKEFYEATDRHSTCTQWRCRRDSQGSPAQCSCACAAASDALHEGYARAKLPSRRCSSNTRHSIATSRSAMHCEAPELNSTSVFSHACAPARVLAWSDEVFCVPPLQPIISSKQENR